MSTSGQLFSLSSVWRTSFKMLFSGTCSNGHYIVREIICENLQNYSVIYLSDFLQCILHFMYSLRRKICRKIKLLLQLADYHDLNFCFC